MNYSQGSAATPQRERVPASPGLLDRLPPQSFFAVSAVFHYLGPSLAVLLFGQVSVLGVAWLRVFTAAMVFAVWRRPWRAALRLDPAGRRVLAALGGAADGADGGAMGGIDSWRWHGYRGPRSP